MKNINIFDLDSKMKEEFEYFLLDWAYHFRKNSLFGNLDEAIKMMTSDTKDEFEKKMNTFSETRDVLSYLEKLKKYGKRPVTSCEIVSALNNNVSERATQKQLQRLKHWKQIEELKMKVNKKDIILFKAI